MRRLLAVALGAGVALVPAPARAQPVVEVRVQGEVEQAVKALEAALAREGLAVYRTFDVGQGVRGRGAEFMPYVLVMLAADGAMEAAVAERPSLAAFLPPTVYVYSDRPGEVTLGTLEINTILALLTPSPRTEEVTLTPGTERTLRQSFARLHEALASLGPLVQREPAARRLLMRLLQVPSGERGRPVRAVLWALVAAGLLLVAIGWFGAVRAPGVGRRSRAWKVSGGALAALSGVYLAALLGWPAVAPALGWRVTGEVARTLRVSAMELDEAQVFLEAALQGYNLNVVDSLTVGPVRQLLACNLSYGEVIFKEVPSFGMAAPCRVFLFADGPDVVVGTVDLDSLVPMFPGLTPPALEAAEEAYGLMIEAFKDLGAQ